MGLRKIWAAIFVSGAFLVSGSAPLRADDSFVCDFVDPTESTLPSWIRSEALRTGDGFFAKHQFAIATPSYPAQSLAVTLYFTEIPGSFLRVVWKRDPSSLVLSENLYEGIGLPNQRTLVIDKEYLQGPGTLMLQAGSPDLAVEGVHFHLIDEEQVYLLKRNEMTPGLVVDSSKVLSREHVEGYPLTPRGDEWASSRIFEAALVNKPERIEEGVQFSFDLGEVPEVVRVDCKFAGLLAHRPLFLWVNDKELGAVNVQWPKLDDPGYLTGRSIELTYQGWLSGTFMIPGTDLKTGENSLVFDVRAMVGLDGQPVGVAIKDFVLEFKFKPEATTPSAQILKNEPVNMAPLRPEEPPSTPNEEGEKPGMRLNYEMTIRSGI